MLYILIRKKNLYPLTSVCVTQYSFQRDSENRWPAVLRIQSRGSYVCYSICLPGSDTEYVGGLIDSE